MADLEGLLIAAGNKLLEPPASVDELLALLQQTEDYLRRVDQPPSDSTKVALSPCVKALAVKDLLRHSNADVKATVAVCICEITRLAAPEIPYDADQMKEIFRLIVSTFEWLWDSESSSYYKRISVVESVAEARLCLIMLELGCHSLIGDMFQHFINCVREDHPENVFGAMETIMTSVFKESVDISLELLSPILSVVRKGNKEGHSSIARKLVKRVLVNCSAKLKPYVLQSLESPNHTGNMEHASAFALQKNRDKRQISEDVYEEFLKWRKREEKIEESKIPVPAGYASLSNTRRDRLAPLLEDISLLKEMNQKILELFSSRKRIDDVRERKLRRLERLEEDLRHFEQLESGLDSWRAKVISYVCLISAIGVGIQVMTGVGVQLLLKDGRK